jgi:hypothetical protein
VTASGCHHQHTRREAGLVQQRVLEQPGQVGQEPAVGVIDDHQQAGGARQAHVLAAGLDRIGVRAVVGGDDLPAGRG